MRLLENRVAVVTGATRGIGLAIARTFASHGASLVIAGTNLETAEAVKANIEALGTKALAVQVDVRDPDQVRQMMEMAVSELGSLDILVNNAGIARDVPLETIKCH